MSPTWTILVATLGQRSAKFKRLMNTLLPQLKPYGKRAKVVALWNNGETSLSAIRQTLLMSVDTDYVNFVDDDDMVSEYYVDRVMQALEYEPDYIGWPTQYYVDGQSAFTIDNSLKYGSWHTRNGKLYRDISHTHTMLTSVAQVADFRVVRRYRAEDYAWVKQVRQSKLLRREVYIPEIMYHYYYSRSESDTWRKPSRIRKVHQRSEINHPNFEWYNGILLSSQITSSSYYAFRRGC